MLLLLTASVIIGLVVAGAYQWSASRMQGRLLSRRGTQVALLTVGSFLGRLTVAGLIFLALGFLTPINVVASVIAFISLYTILSGLTIYRLQWGNRQGKSSQVPR